MLDFLILLVSTVDTPTLLVVHTVSVVHTLGVHLTIIMAPRMERLKGSMFFPI